ncbi:hypothetical protein H311_02422 [Anncaliia algerae PRA109]|nr:hypothetical protein H311_02422 [Anncaliia algerae PRA109]
MISNIFNAKQLNFLTCDAIKTYLINIQMYMILMIFCKYIEARVNKTIYDNFEHKNIELTGDHIILKPTPQDNSYLFFNKLMKEDFSFEMEISVPKIKDDAFIGLYIIFTPNSFLDSSNLDNFHGILTGMQFLKNSTEIVLSVNTGNNSAIKDFVKIQNNVIQMRASFSGNLVRMELFDKGMLIYSNSLDNIDIKTRHVSLINTTNKEKYDYIRISNILFNTSEISDTKVIHLENVKLKYFINYNNLVIGINDRNVAKSIFNIKNSLKLIRKNIDKIKNNKNILKVPNHDSLKDTVQNIERNLDVLRYWINDYKNDLLSECNSIISIYLLIVISIIAIRIYIKKY